MIESVIQFWFEELEPRQHFAKDTLLDNLIKSRFLALYRAVLAGQYKEEKVSPEGCLALVLVLDQFSRNIFRNQAQAFAADTQALHIAHHAVTSGFDIQLSQAQRSFLYMPYMHSEDVLVHEQSIKLFTQLGVDHSLQYALKHQAIIRQFGRYPHRNKVLGRPSTPEEIEFLERPNSSF